MSGEPIVGALEPLLTLATGAVAKPLSDVAGLAAIPLHAAGITSTDPTAVKEAVQSGMTYEPRTEMGKAVNLIPQAIGRGVDWASTGVGNFAASAVPDSSPNLQDAVRNAVKEATNQVIGAAPAAGALVRPVLQGGARSLMQSALKPGEAARRTGTGAQAIDTLLTEPRPGGGLPGYNVSPAGAEALTERIGTLNDIVTDAIRNSPATVDKNLAASRLTSEVNRVANQPSWREDMGAIQRDWQEFLDNPRIANVTDIPVQLAQDMKIASNRMVRGRYGEISDQARQNQKAIRRGLREEISAAVPEVAGPNAEMGPLINARDLVERRVGVEGNKNPAGLGWLTDSPTKFIGWLADRSGASKSTIARLLYEAGQVGPVSTATGMATVPQAAERERERKRRLAEMLKGR
jgi:hypothetical protein